jgi:hypothetical protein
MAISYDMDFIKKLFSDRAGTRGVSSNVSPDKFNRWFNSAEIKFFNQRYDEYSRKQTISDSITKWMTDPMLIPVSISGFFQFFTNMNLLHVDSMSNYLWPGIKTATSTGSTRKPNSVYLNLPAVTLTGYGTDAIFNISITTGAVTNIIVMNNGSNYNIGDTFTFDALPGLIFTVATSMGTNIATFKTLVGGTVYVDGNYAGVPLLGGTGTGATAYFVVIGGIVVNVVPMLQGQGYALNDVLTVSNVSLGGTGAGFSITVNALTDASNSDYAVSRVEKDRWASNKSSTFDEPTQEFSIYTQFSNSFQFAPANLAFAKIIYLQQPVWSYWAYNLAGYINTLTGLVGGAAYTNGTYNNVPLTGGSGNSALATVVVAGGLVTTVTLTAQGKIYQVNDVLSALSANIGGTGAGFAITVSSLVSASIRPIYNAAASIQPKWNNDDISTIIDLALLDAAQASRDKETRQFAMDAQKSQQ